VTGAVPAFEPLRETAGCALPGMLVDGPVGPARSNFDASIQSHFPSTLPVPETRRDAVGSEIDAACTLYKDAFPLAFLDETGRERPFISEIQIGHSVREDEVLTASSAGAPGAVIVVANWPLEKPIRLASLLVHEAMHQALYVRERLANPVRPGSLGYSPWKNTLRPGRMVWHAFWTFSTQLAFLHEFVRTLPESRRMDPGLAEFVADIWARLEICIDSVRGFELVDADEERTMTTVFRASEDRLAQSPSQELEDAIAKRRADVETEFAAWRSSMLSEASPA